MKLKKIMLPVLTLGAISAPIVAVVSCSKDETNDNAIKFVKTYLNNGWTLKSFVVDNNHEYKTKRMMIIHTMPGKIPIIINNNKPKKWYAHMTWIKDDVVERVTHEVNNENFKKYLADIKAAQQGQGKHH